MVERLGKYEIHRSLGRGAMGEVYLAFHPVLQREVAIKTILPSAANGPDAEARFRREATAAGQLNHPNLVTIYDFDREGDVLFLVMEYVKGEDLEVLIRERELTQGQFLEVLAQVCDGLAHAHQAGVIHRDIKPANVRVVREGRRLHAKVMDFGIARTADSSMTSTGIVMGTVSYMAPEYIQNGKATVQADLWAVAVMLYECLSGRKPFQGDNTTTVLFKIVSEVPAPLSVHEVHGISPAIAQVLDQALRKDPGQRFTSAEAFAKALRACKDPSWTGTVSEATEAIARHQAAAAATEAALVPAAAPTQGIPVPPTQMVPAAPHGNAATRQVVPAEPTQVVGSPDGKGSRGLLWALVGGAAVIGVGGGLWLMSRPGTPAPKPEPAAATTTPVQGPVPSPVQTPAQAPANGSTAGSAPSPDGPVQPAATVPVKAAPTPATPAAGGPVPTKGTQPAPVEPPKPIAPKAEPVLGVEEALAQARPLLQSDPRSAVQILKPVAAGAGARDPRLQGMYLAALYQARNVAEFERAYGQAVANGVEPTQMMKASLPFKLLLAQEIRAKRQKQEGVLTEAMVQRIAGDLK